MLSKADVKIRWQGNKLREGRWEVSFLWEGKTRRFYSWDSPHGYVRFTQDNEAWALALKDYIVARCVPNEDGLITWHPDQIRTGAKKSAHIFQNYVKVWLDEYGQLAARGKRSLEYCGHLERYARLWWLPKLGNLHIREINKLVLKDFWLHLCGQDLSDKHVKNIMDGLKKALKDFYEDEPDKCPRFPGYTKDIRPRNPVERTLTEDEQDRVISLVPDIHQPIVRFYLYHGSRPGEARKLMRRDVDLKNEVAIIRTLKGGPDRTIYLEPLVLQDMKSLTSSLHGSMYHWDGKPYSRNTLWRILRQGLDDADFEDVSPYAAGRHSFAANRSAKGQPSLDLQYEMGHADIRTTQRYYHRIHQQSKWCRNGVRKKAGIIEEEQG